MATKIEIEQVILNLLQQRGEGKTICPSEAARRLQPSDWRPLMDPVRAVAKQLIDSNQLVATQKGEPVEIDTAKGPIRLRLA